MELRNKNWGDTVIISRNQFSDIPYKGILQNIFTNYKYQNYLEIGTNIGNSMRYAKNHCIGIDPNFIVQQDIITDKKSLQLYQTTSDDFFITYAKSVFNEKTIDLGFIDGLHYSDQVIRDFCNVLEYCDENSLILVHDVIPRTLETSKKERHTRFWTGDVWRACYVLMESFEKLNFLYVNCPPSGLLIVWHSTSTKQSLHNISTTHLEDRAAKVTDEKVYDFLSEIEYCESRPFNDLFQADINSGTLFEQLNLIKTKKFRIKTKA